MEDYSFEEMQNINKKILLAVEDNQEYILNNIINSDIELMPLRFDYNLSFTDSYIERTKKLFSYYASKDNSRSNELLKLKKHFRHFRRTPSIAYVPNKEEYKFIIEILTELNIKVVDNISQAIAYFK